jgi:hypothetical protein
MVNRVPSSALILFMADKTPHLIHFCHLHALNHNVGMLRVWPLLQQG